MNSVIFILFVFYYLLLYSEITGNCLLVMQKVESLAGQYLIILVSDISKIITSRNKSVFVRKNINLDVVEVHC